MDDGGMSPEQTRQAYDDFLRKIKETSLEVNSREALFLPYEVFKQYNELVTENMKQIYNMLHGISLSRNVEIEFTLGDMSFTVTGPHSDLELLTAKAETMLNQILKRLTKKSVIAALAATAPKDVKDDKKGYY